MSIQQEGVDAYFAQSGDTGVSVAQARHMAEFLMRYWWPEIDKITADREELMSHFIENGIRIRQLQLELQKERLRLFPRIRIVKR